MNNWNPQKFKKVFFSNKDGTSEFKYIFLISDQCWQNLIRIVLEPSFEAIVSPSNFGFRSYYSIYRLQRDLFLNLSKNSFGFQKRVLIFKVNHLFSIFIFN